MIEHSVILSPGPVLRVPLADLHANSVPNEEGTRRKTLEEAEREHILATLKETKGIISGPRGHFAAGNELLNASVPHEELGIVPTLHE